MDGSINFLDVSIFLNQKGYERRRSVEGLVCVSERDHRELVFEGHEEEAAVSDISVLTKGNQYSVVKNSIQRYGRD